MSSSALSDSFEYLCYQYKYVDSYSAGIYFSRQNLTSTFWRLKSIPALYGLDLGGRLFPLTLEAPIAIIVVFYIFYYHIAYQL